MNTGKPAKYQPNVQVPLAPPPTITTPPPVGQDCVVMVFEGIIPVPVPRATECEGTVETNYMCERNSEY